MKRFTAAREANTRSAGRSRSQRQLLAIPNLQGGNQLHVVPTGSISSHAGPELQVHQYAGHSVVMGIPPRKK